MTDRIARTLTLRKLLLCAAALTVMVALGLSQLSRVQAQAAPIPEARPTLPPMAADASPSFEVATIKPSKPDGPGNKGFLISGGRRLTTTNTTLNDLISFAYVRHAKQIIGGPAWAETDKFDIKAEQDGEGAPSIQQWKDMVQKLLADRFQLTFHRDTRELSVYVLTVTKAGPKLTKSLGDPNGLPGLGVYPNGQLNLYNAKMASLAELLQRSVLDRPVVDHTGLAGRYDAVLKWTPDDSQFSGAGARIPPPADTANAPPGLFTAIQEQLGLKLIATRAPDEVLVIDHVEKPSEN